ncbi:M15 family peptidase, partial [Turicibacter sanguinis]|nr:M15 family peptidase [Turicibacter sanguinis]
MWLIAIYQMLFSVVNWSTSMGQEIVEEIEMQGFKIMTLQERYGDEVKQWVYLDESVLGYDDLRYLSVLHFGFDGYIYEGEIIVNQKVADEVLSIFKELYGMRYPIEKMKVMSCYGGSDELSMMDNNSSGFNFREITDGGKLSKHALGLAIDLNPRINPYIKSGTVLP